MYLAWYDASKKRTNADKVGDAWDRYYQKFGTFPTEVLVNPANNVDLPLEFSPLRVRCMDNIAPNTFWIGTPEDNT